MSLNSKKLFSILAKSASAFVSLVFNLVIVGLYGLEKSADVLLLITSLLIGSVILRLGSDQFIVRLISRKGILTRNISRIISSFQIIIITFVILSILILLLLKLASFRLYYLGIIFFVLSVAFYSLTQINSFCLQALRKPVASIFFMNLGFFLLLNILHSILFFFKDENETWSISNFLCILFISTLINYFLSYAMLKPIFTYISSLSRLMRILAINMKYYYFSVLQVLLVWLPQIILYFSIFNEEVASFTFLHRLSLLVGFGLISISSVYAPIIARELSERRYKSVELHSASFIKFSLSFGVLFSLLLGCFIEYGVMLFEKSELLNTEIMWILFLGQFINIITGPCLQILMMGGNVALVQRWQLRTAIVCSIIGVPAILYFGILGAALLTTSILILTNLIYTYFTFKTYKINIYRYLF